MSNQMSQTAPTPSALEDPPSLPIRSAVQRCCDARDRAIQDSKAKKLSHYDTKDRASAAYREAMPDLLGYDDIREFIACVAHAMVIEVIDQIDGPKLLYAAQVAIGALHKAPKVPKTPAA